VKTYTNLALAIAGAAPTTPAGPYTIGAGAVAATNGIPCKGARVVVVKVFQADAVAWANWNMWVMNQASRLPASPGIINAPAGYNGRTPGLLRGDAPGGGSIILEAAGQHFFHDFVQWWGTASGSGHTGVRVSADVYYDGDADNIMFDVGQAATVLTT
jgi:hypothetical protein